MFQIKHIYTLDKDISQSYPNAPDPVWESNYPLNLIVCCAPIGSKSFNQVFVIMGNSISPRWEEFWSFFAELF